LKSNSMKIEWESPSNLKHNAWNTNIVSPENEVKIEESIDRYGMFKPILVRRLNDDSLEILGGAHRAEAAIRKGIERVPIIDLGNISDDKAKEISLVDNGRYGTDDAIKLTELLSSLDTEHDALASFLPYSMSEIDSLFATTSIALEDLDLPDEEEDPEILSPTANIQTHQIMRFKVPIEDAESVTEAIEKIMVNNDMTESDSLTNAGDALVWLIKQYQDN